jgi:DNA ligase-1
VRLARVVATSTAVAETSGRLQKIAHLAELLRALEPQEINIAIAFLTGSPRQGRIGVGYATIREAMNTPAATEAALDLREVDAAFDRLAATAGAGSARSRAEQLRQLFARATSGEQDFLARLLFGELRQGALEGVLLDAVARAAGIPAATLRRSAMLEGSLAAVARTALVDGAAALERLVIQPFKPVQPMLADTAADVDEALTELGEAALEYKLDGARIQVHKVDDEVRIYSRALRDVTSAVPEIVEAARRLKAREAILDGEAIVMRPDGGPQPFQVTMRRFGRKLDVGTLRETLPISACYFDCLYLDGASLIDDPLSHRAVTLAGVSDPPAVVPRILTSDRAAASRFVDEALASGYEGVMAKSPQGLYAAGRRGAAWLKIKRARTLDLVILAVEWGSGRRRGMLSNLHLGARDEERGGFVMLGKTFKGLTDAMLEWQTKALLELELAREGHVVHVRPELVVEIAFNELQESPHYPGGLALRFARVKAYRTDKRAAEADTFRTVQRIYREITGLEPPVR